MHVLAAGYRDEDENTINSDAYAYTTFRRPAAHALGRFVIPPRLTKGQRHMNRTCRSRLRGISHGFLACVSELTLRAAVAGGHRHILTSDPRMPHSIWLALTVNTLGYSAQRGAKVAIALLAVDLGARTWEISLLVALTALVPMLLAFVSGRLSDRVSASRLIALGTATMALALFLPWFSPTISVLFLSATLLGAGFIIFQVATQNAVGLVSSDTNRTRHFAALSLTVSLAGVIGPVSIGVAIEQLGHAQAFACLGSTALVAAVIMRIQQKALPAADQTRKVRVFYHTASLLSLVPLRRVIVVSAAVVGAYDLFTFYLPLHAHACGLSASEIGIVVGAFGVASVMIRFALPPLETRFGSGNLLGAGMVLAACAYGALPLAGDLTALTAIAFLIGLTLGCGPSLTVQMTYARAPHGRTGEALGYRLTAANAANMSLPLVFGGLAAGLGLTAIFLANTMLLGLAALYLGKETGISKR